MIFWLVHLSLFLSLSVYQPVALLHNSNNPGLISFNLLDVFTVGRGLLSATKGINRTLSYTTVLTSVDR